MNAKAQLKQAKINPRGKPSRSEVEEFLRPTAERALQAYVVLGEIAELLMEKGIFTKEELQARITKRHAPSSVPAETSDPVPAGS